MKFSNIAAGSLAAMLLVPSAASGGTAVQPTSTNDLLTDGWTIVQKSEEQRALPGMAPYQNLTRIVQITRYHLRKGNARMTCETTYDSQRDHFEERCTKVRN